MRSEIILAIAKKDLLEVKQNTSAWLPMVIVPLMFAVGLPLIILLAPRNPAFMNQVTADPDLISFIDRLPPVMFSYLEGLDLNQKMVVIFLGFFFAPMFLIMPLMFSTIIAAESFAGEWERKTLEALLYTPASDAELFVGKMTAAGVPAMLLTWICFGLYTLVLNIAGAPIMAGKFSFPLPTWYPLIFWISPALSLLGISATVLISARTKSFMGAYQLSGSLVLVVLALLVGQVTGVLYLSIGAGMLVGLVFWIIAGCLTWLGVRMFKRTTLLTSGD